jgi:MFS family permease
VTEIPPQEPTGTPLGEAAPDASLSAGARYRGIAVLLTNVFLTGMTFGLVVPMLSVMLERDGVPAGIIGLNGSMAMIAIFIVGPLVPRIVARIGVVPTLYLGILLVVPAFLLFPVFRNVEAWFVLRFAVGLGISLYWVVSMTWLNALAGEKTRGRIMGLNAALWGLGYAAGPPLVSVLGIATFLPFAVSGGLLAASSVLIFLARDAARVVSIPSVEGARNFRQLYLVAPLVMGTAVITGFVETGAGAMLPVYGLRSGLDQGGALLMISAMTIGGIAMQLPIGWLADRVNRRRLLIALAAAGLAMTAALPFTVHTSVLLWPVLFIWGGTAIGLYTLGLTLLGQSFPPVELAKAHAMFVMFFSVGSIAGSSGAGGAMSLWDPHGLPVILALAFVLLFLLAARRQRATAGAA